MLKPSAFSTYSGYLKKKKIGEGTYANVHVGIALDKSKEVKVAIKSIKAGLFSNGIDMSAVREVWIAYRLHILRNFGIPTLFQ